MDKTAEKFLDFFGSIDELVFCILMLLLPYGWGASILPLTLFIAIQIFNVYKTGKVPSKQKVMYFAPLLAYFLYSLISISWSNNPQRGYSLIGQQVSLFVIPATYLFLKPDKDLIKKGIRFFIIGIITSALVLLTKAFFKSLSMDGLKFIFNSDFPGGVSNILDSNISGNHYNGVNFSFLVHPSYYGLMVCVAALYMIWGLIPGSMFTVNMKFANSSMIFFSIILILLATNALLINLFVLLIMWLSVSIRNINHHNWERVLAIIFGVLLLLLLVFSPQSKALYFSNLAVLQAKWDITLNTLHAIKHNWLLGSGLGGEQELLDHYLQQTHPSLMGTNPHNQFLQTFLTLGIFGFAILNWSLINMFRRGIQNHTFLMVAYVFLILISFSFESMLYRYWGVVFFSIFYCLIYFYHDVLDDNSQLVRVKFRRNKLVKVQQK